MVDEAREGAVQLTFDALPLRSRVRRHVGLLMRRSPLLVALGIAPFVVVRLSGIDDDGRLTRYAIVLGAATVGLIVVCSLLAVMVARMPTRLVTIDEHTILERVDGATRERTWSWVKRARETSRGIEMDLQPDPPRSLRLAPTKPGRLLLDQESITPEQMARLRAMLRARKLLNP